MSLQPSETGDVSSRGEGAGSQIIGLCTGIGRPRELDQTRSQLILLRRWRGRQAPGSRPHLWAASPWCSVPSLCESPQALVLDCPTSSVSSIPTRPRPCSEDEHTFCSGEETDPEGNSLGFLPGGQQASRCWIRALLPLALVSRAPFPAAPAIYQRVLCSCGLSSPPSMLLTPLLLRSRNIFSLYLCTVRFWLSRKGAQTVLMNRVQVSPDGCSVWVECCYKVGRTLHLPSLTWVQRMQIL